MSTIKAKQVSVILSCDGGDGWIVALRNTWFNWLVRWLQLVS